MLIATARSIKHLNVSADRLCRFLRTNYKLSPYADGLLGRNELKLKLRRKARRQRLAASVGNTVDASSRGLGSDDGITTGWICVNLGVVPADVDQETSVAGTEYATGEEATPEHEEVEEEEEYQNPTTKPDDGYAGFGSVSTSPRIVVQMFTEEKRAEVDLEGLWEARETRRERKEDKREQDVEQSLEEENGMAELETPATDIRNGFVDVSEQSQAAATAGA